MSRYIDADALIKEIEQDIDDGGLTERYVFYRINEAPSIDIVRCGECRWGYKDNEGILWCENAIGGIMKPTDFCSYGERSAE